MLLDLSGNKRFGGGWTTYTINGFARSIRRCISTTSKRCSVVCAFVSILVEQKFVDNWMVIQGEIGIAFSSNLISSFLPRFYNLVRQQVV